MNEGPTITAAIGDKSQLPQERKLVSDWQDGDGVLYYVIGSKYSPMLVVSLYSVRQHYAGPVCLVVGDEAAQEIADLCMADDRLQPLQIVRHDMPKGGGKGLQHANKSRLFELSPFDRTVFLDADTLVVGPFNELLPREGTEEIRLTRYSDWVTTGGKIGGRIERYRDLLPEKVALMRGHEYPAINTGIYGFTKDSIAYFAEHRRLCELHPIFMSDELVAQLIFIDYPHLILDCRWNYSPVYPPKTLPELGNDIRIWHFHGFSHAKIGKADAKGWSIWKPYYERCVAENIACIADWTPGDDKRLRDRLLTRGEQNDR